MVIIVTTLVILVTTIIQGLLLLIVLIIVILQVRPRVYVFLLSFILFCYVSLVVTSSAYFVVLLCYAIIFLYYLSDFRCDLEIVIVIITANYDNNNTRISTTNNIDNCSTVDCRNFIVFLLAETLAH